MSITITNMDESSVDEVLTISNLSFPVSWSKTSFLKELTNPLANYIVAKNSDKTIGFMGVWIIVDEGHITNIAVDPQYRGQGIGDLLMEGIMDVCRSKNVTSMTLEVRSSNLIAQKLYKKHGFIEEGLRKNYYEDNGEDAILMWNHNIK